MDHYDRSDDCQGQARRRNEYSPAKPNAQPLKRLRTFPNCPNNVARKKGRNLGWPRLAENIPKLLVVFAFHCRELNKFCFEKLRASSVRQRLMLRALPRSLPTDESAS